MIRLVLAASALSLLAGCSMLDCGGAAVPGQSAGDCRLHTTFLAAAMPHANTHPSFASGGQAFSPIAANSGASWRANGFHRPIEVVKMGSRTWAKLADRTGRLDS